MPVIADADASDEPPAKCCKHCEESTHSVDGGPASWRLTLDQDLFDTLKGNFPSWFQSSTGSSAAAASKQQLQLHQKHHQYQLVATHSVIPITIDTKIGSNNNNHTLQQQQHQQTAILSHNSSSSSASPASSISSNCSKKSNSSSLSSCSSSSSSSYSSHSSGGGGGGGGVGAATTSRFLNKSTSTTPAKGLARTLKATQKTHNGNSNSCQKLGQLVKSASLHSLSSGSSGCSNGSGSGSSGSGSSSLLANISTSPLTTVELISSAACNGLLATRLSGKALQHSFQDFILLHEAYDDMSEGEQRLHATFLGSSDDGNNSDCYDARQSPPKAIVDSSPLQPAMDKNKESLKVKLMVRRPHSQLVEQGIIPSLKTSPAIHEQCKQLERAKTSDLLKAKIQQRPNREDLERRHILEEDECHIDPSLAEKQRMLKKARLADQLNSQIQHRPGPLELIKKNILHTEKPIEKIVKEGLVSFKATSEGLLTRPQHPHSYVTFDEDSLSSESDTRQTPPRLDEAMVVTPMVAAGAGVAPSPPTDVLQAAAASAGIVTVALTMHTASSGGQLMVSSPQIIQQQQQEPQLKKMVLPASVPPPPPPPPPLPMASIVRVKAETANLFEELCQSVAGPTASPGGVNQFLPMPMLASPCSLASSSTSTLSPLSSIASPPPPAITRLHLQPVSVKSDAPGKDKNRKKSKSKPVSKARTIKFHEYKGPPSAAGQKMDQTQPEETSYQLMLEQQNCLLKFLENLNKNQSILPSSNTAAAAPAASASTPAPPLTPSSNNNSITVTTKTVPALASSQTAPIPAPISLPNTISITSSVGGAPLNFGDAAMLTTSTTTAAATPTPPMLSLIATPHHHHNQQQQQQQPVVAATSVVLPTVLLQHPPPLPSPALSVSSSIPPSPVTSYAESNATTSSACITDITRLEKMKVSDLKQHLKRRNLPVSGPKPHLIERLKPYLPLEPLESNAAATPAANTTEVITISDAMETSNPPPPATILVSSEASTEHEQMDVVQQQQQMDTTHSMAILPQQPQTATIILTNEELLREQQRKIDELQRQLQRSQLELQQIRQRQQQQNQTVVNALPPQQITLITTTASNGGPQQTLTMLPQQQHVEKSIIPTKLTMKAAAGATKINGVHQQAQGVAKKSSHANSSNISTNPSQPPPISQKMVVKQQLEAKIQKQKAAAAAAAQQQQQQQQALQQQQQQVQQQQQQQQVQQQVRLLTQKTQTVLIPFNNTSNQNNNNNQPNAPPKNQAKKSHVAATVQPTTTTTATILQASKPPTAGVVAGGGAAATPHHNNEFLLWNEGNQTIFLVGLDDQHMTAHTLGNISLTATTTTAAAVTGAAAAPAKKLLNGHQRTNSLPSIVFPIEAKSFITQLQHSHFQQQQQHPHQQLIQLDIKPSTAPPPQYEEATKQLAASKAAALNGLVPLVKIKEEPVHSPAPPLTLPGPVPAPLSNQVKRKSAGIKSEQVSDVLDILIKQGELPESAALDPITPLTPLPELPMFNGAATPNTAAGGASIVPVVPKLEAPATPQSAVATVDIAMDTNDSHVSFGSGQHTQHGFVENIDMGSPLQPDTTAIDAESVAKTLDIFLEQHHATPPPSTPPKSSHSGSEKPNSPNAKLNHFDEYELLELMSQQLEMDMGDDSNTYCTPKPQGNNNSLRRDLNSSLQPCINELLEASSPDSVLLNNNPCADVDFDADSFVAQLSQHVTGNGNSPHGHCNGTVESSSSSNSHFNGTPMDCDDFESTLNSFMQAVTQPEAGSHGGQYSTTTIMANSEGGGGEVEGGVLGDSGGGAVDAFNASGDIFDLFNMDDYKMNWAAGDFTV
ncbi:nascent polypeptide-associated complex subunit alpha, muscle-specific form isoform X2 [Drosophila pseudoobscura]|uniref:Nascent polypeptide-associated complex subunit alpha, muscle-specific form isoform X2 n=1 Tax=Drosophila pseudoobscura pseudoobscura TaxID=46245 RepID=A0A6I8VJA0_DROPS|nr:nascent polypeptide-associated complex subunit alpha, muscle-specific form isoform X2 [Drosophila pseudoobscura]